MMTAVDQVSPWLTPKNRLAMITHSQVGAHINRNGTGAADPPSNENRLTSPSITQPTGKIVRYGLGHTEHGNE